MSDPMSTRHEGAGPGATRREDTGPGATRREDARHAATRRENAGPAATRREDAGPGRGWAMVMAESLPADLAERLSELTPIVSTGGEASIIKARDIACGGQWRVLKAYYPHIQPDPEVWSQLASIRSRNVVEVVETGTLADGRVFELMEFLPDGSLRDAGAGHRAFDAASVTRIVRQLAAGLTALHQRGITHRDLKPENVLVRGRLPDIELVLTDFGLSRRLDNSAHFTTGARTSAYAAPESWAGHVSPARDWWSLGIVVHELITGQQPFQGLDERMIQVAVTTKPVPVDMITDVRINRLCAGLLVSDEKKRWNGTQVREWLAGRSPDVPDRRVPIDATEFEFDGRTFRDPEALAVALAGNWRLAARRYGISPSPSWTALTAWLHQFDQPGLYPPGVVERRLDLLGQLEQSTEKPDAKLVRLLAGLNPKQPPIFRQLHIDVPKLRELARQAQDGAEDDPGTRRAREIVDELWDARLLGVLARFDGAGELSRVDTRWQSAVRALRAVTVELSRDSRLTEAVSGAEHRTAIRAALLEFAAWPARGKDWLREIVERGRALAVPVPWYATLVDRAGTDPVRGYGVLLTSGVARAEAQRIVLAREAAAEARRARERRWQDHERLRLGRRGRALLRAAAGATVLSALWFVLLLFVARTPQLALVLVAMVTHYAAEFWLARTLGADYHPGFSLWQGIGVASGRVGGRLRGAPRAWAVGIIALLVVLGAVTWLLPLAAVLAGLGHLGWSIARHRRWSKGHDQDRRRTLAE